MNAASPDLAGPVPRIERVREGKSRLAQACLRQVLPCRTDLFGIPKIKPMPLTDFMQFPEGCVSELPGIMSVGRRS